VPAYKLSKEYSNSACYGTIILSSWLKLREATPKSKGKKKKAIKLKLPKY